MQQSDIDTRFQELTHPGPGRTPDLDAIKRFLWSDHVVKISFLVAHRAAVRLTRRVDDRDDRAHDAALYTIETVMRKAVKGKIVQPSPPLASLTAYMRRVIERRIKGKRRVKVPPHVRARGRHAIWLFQTVIVANQPLSESLDELVAAYPGEEDTIRGHAAEVIREYIRHPHKMPKLTLAEHYTKGVADVEVAAPGRARSVTGRQMVSPEDAALAVLTREAIEAAVEQIEDRTLRKYARAWYVERTVGSVAELEQRFGMKDGKHGAKTMKDLLAVELHHLKPHT